MTTPLQMRLLSQRQAQRCEDACEPVCKCRCGGALHGVKRGSGAGFFSSLTETDPHFIPSKEQKAAKKKAEQDEKWKRRMRLFMDVQTYDD